MIKASFCCITLPPPLPQVLYLPGSPPQSTPHPFFYRDFPGGTVGKESPLLNEGDTRDAGSTSGSGRSPGGGDGYPLQHSCLENPMDMGARGAAVRGVTKEPDTTERTRTHAFFC